MPGTGILCVGGNPRLRRVYTYLLLNDLEVRYFPSLAGFWEGLKEGEPEGILADLDLEGGGGVRLLRELRRRFAGPLVILGENFSLSRQIEVFEYGADDYLCREEEPALVLARLQAVCSRYRREPAVSGEVLSLLEGRLVLDERAYRGNMEGRPLNLTLNEWKILLHLVKAGGRAVSRRELLEATLDYRFDGYSRILDSYIRKIRQKLGLPECVETLRGYGYRFAGIPARGGGAGDISPGEAGTGAPREECPPP